MKCAIKAFELSPGIQAEVAKKLCKLFNLP